MEVPGSEEAASSESESLIALGCVGHMETLFTSFQEFYQQRLLTDVVLVAEGVEFEAHAAVLAAYSPSFLDMVKRDIPLKDCKVVLNNTTSACLELLLDFLYSGTLKLNPANAALMYVTAQQLKLESAVALCHRYLEDFVPDSSVTQESSAAMDEESLYTLEIKQEGDQADDVDGDSCVLDTEISEPTTSRDSTKSGEKSGSETPKKKAKPDARALSEPTTSSDLTKSGQKSGSETPKKKAKLATTKSPSAGTKSPRRRGINQASAKTEEEPSAEGKSPTKEKTSQKDRYCELCDKYFTKPYMLMRHRFQAHGMESPAFKTYDCSEKDCRYRTYSQYELNRHMSTHRKKSGEDAAIEMTEKMVEVAAPETPEEKNCENAAWEELTKENTDTTPETTKKETMEADTVLETPAIEEESGDDYVPSDAGQPDQESDDEVKLEEKPVMKKSDSAAATPSRMLTRAAVKREPSEPPAELEESGTEMKEREEDGIRVDRYCNICQKEFSKPYIFMRHTYQVHGVKHPSFTPNKYTPISKRAKIETVTDSDVGNKDPSSTPTKDTPQAEMQLQYKTETSSEEIQTDRYCKLCKKHFSKPAILKRHESIVHGGKDPSKSRGKKRKTPKKKKVPTATLR